MEAKPSNPRLDLTRAVTALRVLRPRRMLMVLAGHAPVTRTNTVTWLAKAATLIRRIPGEVRACRAVFLNESDLQFLVASKLVEVAAEASGAGLRLAVHREIPWYDEEAGQRVVIDLTMFDDAMIRVGYVPNFRRKGYRHDNEAIAVELKYCRYTEDVGGVAADVLKLRPLAANPQYRCFVLALARTTQIAHAITADVKGAIAANDFSRCGSNPIRVYVVDEEAADEAGTWEATAPG